LHGADIAILIDEFPDFDKRLLVGIDIYRFAGSLGQHRGGAVNGSHYRRLRNIASVHESLSIVKHCPESKANQAAMDMQP
jgi:hypothetical protein